MGEILIGDCCEQLRDLPEKSVQMAVTSPPYYCLRKYCDDERQIGLEETPEEYVARLVEVFHEVRRVLRDDGTVWLNLGDSYAGSGGRGNQFGQVERGLAMYRQSSRPRDIGLKPTDLIGIPWRVAFALQRPYLQCKGCGHVAHMDQWGRFPDGRLICPACEKSEGHSINTPGWYLRSDIIWSKKNCTPEPVKSRPTRSHEFIFLLAKNKHYFYDSEAIREKGTIPAGTRGAKGSFSRRSMAGVNGRPPKYAIYDGTRNKRDVWNVATRPFKESHFATYPPDLIEPCILAGTSERGCCSVCGAPYRRVMEIHRAERDDAGRTHGLPEQRMGKTTVPERGWESSRETVGWEPTCTCNSELPPVPCTVLDPFFGAGTTGVVAKQHRRNWIGIELNPEYAEMAQKRIQGVSSAPVSLEYFAGIEGRKGKREKGEV